MPEALNRKARVNAARDHAGFALGTHGIQGRPAGGNDRTEKTQRVEL
mgnify:CR=1 FL=1